jgi:hypothetical protein
MHGSAMKYYGQLLFPMGTCDFSTPPRRNLLTRVGFLPWQKVFLPGQWKKLVKTGKNRQKPAKTGKRGIRSLTLLGSSKRLNLLNLNLQL